MRILEVINRGGFGRVERVSTQKHGIVARKVFCPMYVDPASPDYEKLKKRFKREVRIQSEIRSNSIIPILDFSLDIDEPWFLMPLADRNFYEEIDNCKKSGTIPQNALADILNALEELHELGYVHRDLKPHNVLLHEDKWKLTDFGLVLPPGGTTTRLTSVDSAWGTLGYCAPEQVLEFHNVTKAVDIYAFGCILHDIYESAPRLPYQRYSVPGPIGQIIEKCTESKPEKRFKSVQSLRGSLLTLLSDVPDAKASPRASEWVEALKGVTEWNQQMFEQFVRYVVSSSDEDDRNAILKALDEDMFEALFSLDKNLSKVVSINYCEWVSASGFNYDYCDVLIKRLEKIHAHGDLECQAESIIAGAELAKSHNRWFVMGRVIALCGSSMEDSLAQRMRIEIRARELENNFRRCASGINRNYSSYHPVIAEALGDESEE